MTSLKALLKRLLLLLYNAALDRKKYRFVIRDLQRQPLETWAALLATLQVQRRLVPIVMQGPPGQRALIIAPHPDDEVIGPGGTLIRYCSAGGKARVLFLTAGNPVEAAQRMEEARRAADAGGWEIRFLGTGEQFIPVDEKTATRLASEIVEFSPDHLFLPALFDDNDDHRRASQLLLHAAPLTGTKVAPEIWAYQVYSMVPVNVVVDITDVSERKAKLVRLHASQFRSRNWSHYALGLNAFNQRFLPGRADAAYAETFFVLPFADYLDLCRRFFADPSIVYRNTAYRNPINKR